MSKRKISCCQAKLTMMLISNNVMNYNDTNDLQFHHIFFSSFDVTISDGPGSISFEILNRILSAAKVNTSTASSFSEGKRQHHY